MHIDIVPNRGSKPAVLLRESYREGKKVRKRTLANLSKLPMEQVEMIRRVLKGERLASASALFEVTQSRLHGHVQAVRSAMQRLGFDSLIASRRTRERDLVVAMVAARILEPEASKLETTRWWTNTTLAQELDVVEANENDLYGAMDWVLERQGIIEQKLAKRHLRNDGLVLYDLTSSYFEGKHCPLAKLGHNRDGKRGKLQINYGVLTDARGCPVSVSVFAGNTGDSKTLEAQVKKAQREFGLARLAIVGDRGMISQTQINTLTKMDGVHWITALRTEALRKLAQGGELQRGLFDECNLFEFSHEDYPGERLVACHNLELARLRRLKRQDLLAATEKELQKVQGMVERGRLKGRAEIGVRVGKVVNKYKVAKHFILDIQDRAFAYRIDEQRVAAEASLDGIYIIRTSLPAEECDAETTVRSYKRLSQVERAFRTMKGIDLKVRPIHHHLENRVRAHIFLCMLAYYVQWHMMEAWRPLLFADEEQDAKQTRDPVAPANRSQQAWAKVRSKRLEDGSIVHSFHSLLQHMQTIVRNTCRRPGAAENEMLFTIDTRPNPKQQHALDLLKEIQV
jgi:transposase